MTIPFNFRLSLFCAGVSGIAAVFVLPDLIAWWAFGGVAMIVAVFLPIIEWGERRGIITERWEWVPQEIGLGIWLLGLVLLAGIRNGLSVHMATLWGMLSIAGGAITAHRAHHLETIGEMKHSQNKVINRIALIAILGGVILIFIPSPRLVIFDWPCREEEWVFKAADKKWINAVRDAYLDDQVYKSVRNAHRRALNTWKLCRGRIPQ